MVNHSGDLLNHSGDFLNHFGDDFAKVVMIHFGPIKSPKFVITKMVRPLGWFRGGGPTNDWRASNIVIITKSPKFKIITKMVNH